MPETLYLVLDKTQVDGLNLAFANAQKERPDLKTKERFLYDIFRPLGVSYGNARNRMELAGFIEQVPAGGQPGQEVGKKLKLRMTDLDLDAVTPPGPPEELPSGTTLFVVKVPSKLYENLRFGIALQNVWNKNNGGESRGAPVYGSFDEWAASTLVDALGNHVTRIDTKSIEDEEKELYPEMAPAKPTAKPGQPTPKKNHFR
jgi:hypothetical protein